MPDLTKTNNVNPLSDNALGQPDILSVVEDDFENENLGDSYLLRRERSIETAGDELLRRFSTPEESKQSEPRQAKLKSDKADDNESFFESAGETALSIGSDIFEGVFQEAPRAVLGGVRDAVQELFNIEESLAQSIKDIPQSELFFISPDVQAPQLPDLDDPDSNTGQFIKAVAQFTTGFVPALKGVKGVTKATTKAGKLLQINLAGALADATVFDDQRQNLANLIEEQPLLKNPVTEFLSSDPEDNEALARFKKAIEGFGIGAAGDALFAGVKALSRFIKIKPKIQQAQIESIESTAVKKSQAKVPEQAKSQIQTQAPDSGITKDTPTKVTEPAIPKKELDQLFGAVDQPLTIKGKITDKQAQGFLKVTGDIKGKAININLAKLDTGDDIKEAISKAAKIFPKEIDEARRGVQSNKATKALADDLGLTVDTLLKRRRGQAFNAEEALASRRILVASGENLVQTAKLAVNPNATPIQLLKYRQSLSIHAAIQEQVSGLTAEAGRSLQAFKIKAESKTVQTRAIKDLLDTGGVDRIAKDSAEKIAAQREIATQTRAIKELMDTGGGDKVAIELAEKIATLDTPEQINAFARQASKATKTEMVFEAWINGLLSNPVTHTVNTLSNSVVALWQIPERQLAARIGKLSGSNGVQVGEAKAQIFGLVQGIKEGFQAAKEALVKGQPSDRLIKLEGVTQKSITAENLGLSGFAGRAVDLIGETVRLPGRFLMSEDEFFKSIGYRMELNARAFRQATEEALDVDSFAGRIKEIIDNPPKDIELAAIDASRYQTFTNPLGKGGQFDRISKGLQRITRESPVMRLMLPFIRTPVNIIKFVGERSVLAPLSKSIRADIAAGGARRDLALARISLGSMIMATASDMTSSGLITGGGPTDPRLKAALRRTGWQPYSLKIGGTYFSFNRFDPLGQTFGIAADVTEIMGQLEESEAEELAAATVIAVSNNVINKTYMQGLASAIAVMNQVSPEIGADKGLRFLKKFAVSLIPFTSLVGQLERISDPTLRATRDLTDEIRARIPGYSKDLPPRRNLWGEPIILSGALGPDIISPIYTSFETDSAIDHEIVRLKLPLSMPSKTISGVELSLEQHDKFILLAGNEWKNPATGLGLKDTLNALIKTQEYKDQTDGPDGGKALKIRAQINAFRAGARAQLLDDDEELETRVRENKLLDAEKLLPQN